jgi:hypothetical protein
MRMSRYVQHTTIGKRLILGNPQNGDHRWSCPKAEVPCDHAEMGCPALIKRSDLKNHLANCFFEQVTPCLNMMKGEIEELKRDRDSKAKQIDGLSRAQARLNDRLANIRPFSAFTSTAGRVSTAQPGASDLETDARLVRAMEIVRQRRQARLNAQPITESVPERLVNPVSGTPRTPAQSYTRARVPAASVTAALHSLRDTELELREQTEAYLHRSRIQGDRLMAQNETLTSAPTSMSQEVADLPIARPRRTRAPARINDPEDGHSNRPSRPVGPADPSSTAPAHLPDTQSVLHVPAPDSDIQPPSTASTQRDFEVPTPWRLKAQSSPPLRLPIFPMYQHRTPPTPQRRSTRRALGAPTNPPTRSLSLPVVDSTSPCHHPLSPVTVSRISVSSPRPTTGPRQLPITDLTDPQGYPRREV